MTKEQKVTDSWQQPKQHENLHRGRRSPIKPKTFLRLSINQHTKPAHIKTIGSSLRLD